MDFSPTRRRIDVSGSQLREYRYLPTPSPRSCGFHFDKSFIRKGFGLVRRAKLLQEPYLAPNMSKQRIYLGDCALSCCRNRIYPQIPPNKRVAAKYFEKKWVNRKRLNASELGPSDSILSRFGSRAGACSVVGTSPAPTLRFAPGREHPATSAICPLFLV